MSHKISVEIFSARLHLFRKSIILIMKVNRFSINLLDKMDYLEFQ